LVVDIFALGNPFLAHMPSLAGQRIGHFKRRLPGGYLQTLRTGQNKILDPVAAGIYERIARITQAPVWDRARWQAIVTEALQGDPAALNTEHYQTDLRWEEKLMNFKNPQQDAYAGLIQSGADAFNHAQYARAEHVWQQAKLLNPKSGMAEGDLGILYALQGDFQQAAENFQAAEEKNPEVWRNLAGVFLQEWQTEISQ